MAEQISTDVVVVGAGIAGLSAALEAHQMGVNIAVVEKLKAARGNTHYAGGGHFHKVSRSPKEIVQEAAASGKGRVDADLVRSFAENVNDGIDWMASLGLEWYRGTPVSGRPRSLEKDGLGRYRVRGGGAAICRTLVSAVKERGIDVWYQTRADKILTDGHGTVTGLRVESKRKQVEFSARTIVLATGGFQGNKKMVETYIGPWLLRAKYSGSPFNTGDGHVMASELGAQLIHMDQWHGSLRNRHRINPYPRLQYGSILVNGQGFRFVDEIGNTKDFIAKALAKEEGCRGVVIFDENIRQSFVSGFEEHLLEHAVKGIPPVRRTKLSDIEDSLQHDGTLIRAASLRELSEKLGIPRVNLEGSIAEYNYAVANHRLGDLAVPRMGHAFKIETPPFYAEGVLARLNCTLGGVRINTQAEVVDKDDQPIPGLYAAGEVMGGFYYDNYQVITGYLPVCLVFGRIAGVNAAKNALSVAS